MFESDACGGQLRIVGFDPGLRVTGWGVLEVLGTRITHVGNGVCRSNGDTLGERLASLYTQLKTVVEEFVPDEASIENTFVSKDFSGSLKLGNARAISLLVAAQAGLPIGEYAPRTIKRAIVGAGHAEKDQVERMLRMQLPGVDIAGPDASDALAIAMTHAVSGKFSKALAMAIDRARN